MPELRLDQPVFTGERAVPDDPASQDIFLEHLARYRFAQQFVRGLRVLDAACGLGYGTAMLVEGGAQYALGIDIDSRSVEYAKRRYGAISNLQFVHGSVENLTHIVSGPFEFCVSFETIEHLEKPKEFLTGIQRILVPGGRLLISTPNRYVSSPESHGKSRPRNPFHHIEWTVREFTSLLADYFEVSSVLGQVFFPRRQAWVDHWRTYIKSRVPKNWLTRSVHAIAQLGYRPLSRAFDRQTHNSLEYGAGGCPDSSLVAQYRDERNLVRTFYNDETPTFVVCLCRKIVG